MGGIQVYRYGESPSLLGCLGVITCALWLYMQTQ